MPGAGARRRILGIDFSGARDAGRHIWIAEGRASGHGLVVDWCYPARELPRAGDARDAVLAALVEYVRKAGPVAAGMDFPFGLPAQYVAEPDWKSFVAGFRIRYPTADAFRAKLHESTGGREVRRRTDIRARTPFCPWNLRLYRQTWHGIADVLAPLVLSGAARAVPMQPPDPARPLLLETCPASLLKATGLYQRYKGRSVAARTGRERILEAMVELRLLHPLPPVLRAALLGDTDGDALDAALAAICVLRAVGDPHGMAPSDCIDRLEARVYY